MFIDWFERVYKAAPNAIEDELERARARCTSWSSALGAEMSGRLELFERPAGGREYLLGELGGAATSSPTRSSSTRSAATPPTPSSSTSILDDHQPLGDSHPNLRAWIERVGELPRAY